jgi:hypothetical protein
MKVRFGRADSNGFEIFSCRCYLRYHFFVFLNSVLLGGWNYFCESV